MLSDDQSVALQELLLALADDEFVMGFANSEWTGIAPMLEEDIAFSSLAQDELGHARVYYELLASISGQSADSLAYGRDPSAYRHTQMVERPRGDWAYSVSRQFLYDTADYLRLESLQRSSYAPLVAAVNTIIREEKYHLMHANTWLQRLAEGSAEARQRQQAAFEALWPDALGFFEPLPAEATLLEAGILAEPWAAVQQRWLAQIADPLQRLGLPFPFTHNAAGWEPQVAPLYGGRRGGHTADFQELYTTITSVYRLEPGAQW